MTLFRHLASAWEIHSVWDKPDKLRCIRFRSKSEGKETKQSPGAWISAGVSPALPGCGVRLQLDQGSDSRTGSPLTRWVWENLSQKRGI